VTDFAAEVANDLKPSLEIAWDTGLALSRNGDEEKYFTKFIGT
jgi:hypothetical protein